MKFTSFKKKRMKFTSILEVEVGWKWYNTN